MKKPIKDEHLSSFMLACGILLAPVAVFFLYVYHDLTHRSGSDASMIGFFGAVDIILSAFWAALMYALGAIAAVFSVQLTSLGGTMLFALKSRKKGSFRIVRLTRIILIIATLAIAAFCILNQLMHRNTETAIFLLIGSAIAEQLPVKYLIKSKERLSASTAQPKTTSDTEAEFFETTTDTDRKNNS